MNMIAETNGPFRMMEAENEHLLFCGDEIVGKAIRKGNVWVALLQKADRLMEAKYFNAEMGEVVVWLWDNRHGAYFSGNDRLH